MSKPNINFAFLLCIFLGGCVTTKNAAPLADNKAGLTSDKGVLGYSVSHKTDNAHNFFPPVPWLLKTRRYTIDEDDKKAYANIINVSNIFTKDLNETGQLDYKTKDNEYIYEPGLYYITESSLQNYTKTNPGERNFEIKPGQLTYIGDFIYESISTGKDWNYDLQRVILNIECNPKEFRNRFIQKYPEHHALKINNACVNEGKFRRLPANGSVWMHIQYTPAS